MITLVRRGDFGDALPYNLTGLAVEAHDNELMLLIRTCPAVGIPATSLPLLTPLRSRLPGRSFRSGSFSLGDLAGWDRRRQIDPIVPDHRSRKPAPRDLDFPFDIF